VAALAAATASTLVAVGGASAAPVPPVGPPSHLKAVGPISGENGFPVWYKDSNNVSMGLCLNGADPLCGFLPGDIPNPDLPVSFPDNFPDESFYQLAGSTITLPTGPAVLVNGLEAAFSSAAPADGQQIVFGRVRIRITAPQEGHYKVTHPYGVDEFDVTDVATRNINFVEDTGIGAPGDFTGALKSRIDPFLRWDTGFFKGPDGSSYLGDPNVEHKITGSALGTNYFKIEGPNIGGPGINVVTNDLFTIQGKVATNAGVAPQSVTYTATGASGGYVDVFASSQPEQAIQVSGAGISTTTLKADVDGRYFGRVAYSGSNPPATVTVTNVSDRPPTALNVTVTDRVVVSQASYDADANTLTVKASSSDTSSSPALSVQGFGPLTAGSAAFNLGAGVPPPIVTVTSARSGSDSAPVTVTGSALAPEPVVAQTPGELLVQQGQTVQLDGSGSLNATGYSWAQTGGPAVTLTGQTQATASFTAPAGGSVLTFRLTVTGPDGPKTADSKVTVQTVAPPIANAGQPQSVLQGASVALDASASQGATGYLWKQTAGVSVTLTGASTAKPKFTMPVTNDPLIFQVTVNGPGGSDMATVQISPKPDVLTTDQVEFRQSKREWRVSGTASIVETNTVTVWVGTTTGAPAVKLGTATVDALGVWSLRLANGTPPNATTPRISIESTRGGRSVNIPVVVRN
jgi:hypothetical protein